jgi:hypothetical protein
MRPEFAAWRYGDQFGRRQRRNLLMVGGAVVGGGAALAGAAAIGVSLVAIAPAFHVLNMVSLVRMAQTNLGVTYPTPDGRWFAPVGMPRLVSRGDVPEGWGLLYGHRGVFDTPKRPPATSVREWFRNNSNNSNLPLGELHIRGNDAATIMRRVLPRVNRAGASRGTVAEGVGLIEAAGGPEVFGTWAATQRGVWAARQTFGDTGDLAYIPAPARLAFEMAMHEDNERRALEGELAALEAAWQQADEIAKIADDMFVAPNVEARLEALRTGGGVAADPSGTRITAAD